ncbi:NmrA family NAD(P)-binding protein [Mesorhizobium sp. NPDC059054]|uniref:NmrA family NAD(P)-binding protein n=1 Tax=Mesorhizobium sp. NPDC059054 TaxID=3346711 RepID=UPI003697C053
MADTASEILVLGATGTVGSLVLHELLAKQHRVRAGSRSPHTLLGNAKHYPVDVKSGAGLPQALDGVTKLFLVTPDMDDQLEAEQRIVDQAIAAGVGHIVKLSAFRAEDEIYLLGRTHRQIERHIEASGLTWTFLRPSAFMQNFVTYYAPALLGERRLRLPCGDAPVSFIDARDIATIAAKALTDPAYANRSFEMFGPEPLSYADAVRVFSSRTGIECTYEPISDDAYCRLIEGPSQTYERIVDLFHCYSSGRASGEAFDMIAHAGRPLYTMNEFALAHREQFLAGRAS